MHELIRTRYGLPLLHDCRRLERITKKFRKAQLDLEFLQYCALNDTVPNFVKFKLYRSSLYNTQLYSDTTKRLLQMEIKVKEKLVDRNAKSCEHLCQLIQNSLSIVDTVIFKDLFNKNINDYVSMIKRVHWRKLRTQGISVPNFRRENKTLFNFSKYVLSSREEFLLSFGLDFCLPNYKPSYCKFFLPLELLFHNLRKLPFNTDLSGLQFELSNLAHNAYRSMTKEWTPFFKKSDYDLLRDLAARDDLIIIRPDKGKGTVIMDKTNYIEKMNCILSNETKFLRIGEPNFSTIFRVEDKINRFLKQLKENNTISEKSYHSLYSTGGSYGTLYGLPKTHKEGLPMRPILTSYETPNYKLAKYLVPLLEPLTRNEYQLSNSLKFREAILPQDSDLFMVSLDVESLFTNVPVEETIDIIINKIFTEPDSLFHNFNKPDFRKLLELAVLDTPFLFNGSAYKQVDGMAMGSPLGPTFANIFMCTFEEQLLENCPISFYPLFYRRYVDDTFALFRTQEAANSFKELANAKHPNIKFTIEHEQNHKLAFLDILVFREDDHFNTAIFRKLTFTGLGSNFYSSCFKNFKLNALSTLLHRAITLTSSWQAFNNEIEFLHKYFVNNCFPSELFFKYVNKLLADRFVPIIKSPSVPKLPFYSVIPFTRGNEFQSKLHRILSKHFGAVSFKLIPINPLKIGSLFQIKDRLSYLMTSGVVYKYTCPRCKRGTYIGSTRRLLKVRVDAHKGVSYRTGSPLTNPEFSCIRDHAKSCKCSVEYKNFEIVSKTSNELSLAIMESLTIKRVVPSLNTQTTSTPLFLS